MHRAKMQHSKKGSVTATRVTELGQMLGDRGEAVGEREFMRSQGRPGKVELGNLKDIAAELQKEGKKFSEAQEQQKIEVIERTAQFMANVERSGQKDKIKKRLNAETEIKSSPTQTVGHLVLQGYFGMSKATASRLVAIIRFAAVKQHPFKELGRFINNHRGISNCAREASRHFNGKLATDADGTSSMRISISDEVKKGILAQAKEKEVFNFAAMVVVTGATAAIKLACLNEGIVKDIFLIRKLQFRFPAHDTFGDPSVVPDWNN